jgi:hypothetical protein
MSTVNVNVRVADPDAFVAVIVKAVADATDVGVPVSAPVEVLKLIPGGVALIAKLAMAPPVELIVNPVAAVLTVRVSEEEERVKAGAANGTAAGTTAVAGNAAVITPAFAKFVTAVEPATVKKLALTPVRV